MTTEADRTPYLPKTPPSSTHQDSIILNDFGGTRLTQRTRTTGTGKATVRMTMDIKATPILMNMNGLEMGRGPADAIRGILTAQTKAITARASESTLLKRKYAEAALARGEPWAIARYTGGRIGLTRPGAANSDAFGNDSGRLADGWFVTQNPKEGSWTINAPANRLDPKTWGGSGFEAFVARFVSLVPALREPRTIFGHADFVAAVEKSSPVVAMRKNNARAWKEWIRAANAAVGLGSRIVDLAG